MKKATGKVRSSALNQHAARKRIELIDDMEALIVGRRFQSERMAHTLKGYNFNKYLKAEVGVCNQLMCELWAMREQYVAELNHSRE